jgi:hypothetical protein
MKGGRTPACAGTEDAGLYGVLPQVSFGILDGT